MAQFAVEQEEAGSGIADEAQVVDDVAGGFFLGIDPGSSTWWWSRIPWVLFLLTLLMPVAFLLAAFERRPFDPNASIPTPQPVHYRPMFGALGKARTATCMTFLSGAAVEAGVAANLQLRSLIGQVSNCRDVTKASMILNDYQPDISVDPQTYQVRADGELLVCEPAGVLPLAQKYFLF